MDRVVSHYRIEQEIGRGGMGVVYRGVDTKLGRPVAIKVLPADVTADADRHHRFVREAQSASALNHPNIVTIYEIGEDAGTTFIAMELVEGTPLDKALAGGALPIVTALDYAMQAADALAAAHARGIVHRDIKPANIVVTPEGRVKVLDFGLAKLIERGPSEPTITAMATVPGIVMGTLAYMSPEQAEGRPVDARSDIFSLGAVIYEMLTGRRPFAGSSDAGLISAILRDDPPQLRSMRADAPADVEAIVARALAKDPAARYPNAGALRAALMTTHARLTRPPEPSWRRRAVLIPVALLLIAVAGIGAWQMLNARRARWAREVAIPEIERLHQTAQSLEAVRLARNAERYAPAEVARARDTWLRLDITTDPEGAQVAIRNYLDETVRGSRSVPRRCSGIRFRRACIGFASPSPATSLSTSRICRAGRRSSSHPRARVHPGWCSSRVGESPSVWRSLCWYPTTGSTSSRSPTRTSSASWMPADTATGSTGSSRSAKGRVTSSSKR